MKHFSVADPDPIGNVFLKAFFGKFDEKPSFRFIQYDTEPQPKTCSYCTAQVHSAQCTLPYIQCSMQVHTVQCTLCTVTQQMLVYDICKKTVVIFLMACNECFLYKHCKK